MITNKTILTKININTNSKIQKLNKNNINTFILYLPSEFFLALLLTKKII